MRLLIIPLILIATACTNTKEKESSMSEDKLDTSMSVTISSEQALSMLETTCYVCHNPNTASHDEILAPPLAGIKMAYINATDDRLGFIERMSAFVSNPNADSAMMKGPIKRFGLMPITGLSKDQIKAIVTYIHDNDISEPAWFKAHENEMHNDSVK